MKQRFFGLILFLLLGASMAFGEEPLDSSSYGRVRTTVEFNALESSGDKLAWYDMATDAFLGFAASKTLADGWKSGGVIEFDLQSADVSIQPQYLYVTLENTYALLSIGRQESSGGNVGGEYLENIDNSLSVGQTVGTGDFFKTEIKTLETTFVTGRHSTPDTSVEGGNFDESVLAFYFESEIAGLVPVAFSYANVHETPARNRAALASDSVHGNELYTAYSLGFGIPFGESQLSLNFDKSGQKHIDSRIIPDENKTTLVYIFDWALTIMDWFPEGSGVTAIYSSQGTADGSANNTDYTGWDIGFLVPLKGLNLFGAYSFQSTVDLDDNLEEKASVYGLGLAYHFGK